MQATRASRISEVEWNARRPKLEKLYLDDNLSRQEVLEIMAREDNFFATEKQLKYQFNKWGLKKYIKERELSAMLSLKRKRQELGKNTNFVYQGHLFEQERLERASKRRKAPLISSPVLPPYIRALVSPPQSPPVTCSLQPYCQTSAVPASIEGALHDSGRSSILDLSSNCSFHHPGDLGSSAAYDSLGVFSNPLSFDGGGQSQANDGPWETLPVDSSNSFSPTRRSFMPSPHGRDMLYTSMENVSPLTQQMNSIPTHVPAAQSPRHNDFPLSDLDLDIDFSMYLNSPHRPSTASSFSCTGPNIRRSVERTSISPSQLTKYDDKYRENGEYEPVSNPTAATDQALDPVTRENLEAESIVSMLLLLKSLAFPRFDIASQKYEYEKSMISDLFSADWCEWMCHDVEELLGLYLEESLRSIRKRRTARVLNPLPSGCEPKFSKRRQGFERSDEPEQLSDPTEATFASKMRTTFFRRCFTPVGQIVFKVSKGSSSPIAEEGIDANHLITISFMPRPMERTLGICVQSSRMMGAPAISPQIRTFNIVPDNSAIIQCVRNNDLRGIQTLFDMGAASARDVDSAGISLLHYAMYTGCSDVFRLLIQGGASTNECDDYRERTTDIVTVAWKAFMDAYVLGLYPMGLSVEKVKNFEECVAMTQLALDNNCTIDSANPRVICAGPLFSLVWSNGADIDASVLVDAITYLLSIGYDLEETNRIGQTPLLLAAAVCGPQIARCLDALVGRGANLNARDDMGRGPLLSALAPPLYISNWMDLTFDWDIGGNDCDNNWDLKEYFRTDDHRYVRDYYDAESIIDPLGPHISHMSRFTPSLDVEDRQLSHDQGSSFTTEQLELVGLAMSDIDSSASSCSEKPVSSPEDDDYVYALDDEGDGVWIRNPSHVLKDRVRVKLKVLLEAGCDPNDFDNDGQSTNDYARYGLWSQWLWALNKTGYFFDEEQDRWVKRIDPA